MSVESTEALERSVLESKDREQLLAIAGALGVKATSRAKKADIIAKILEQTGAAGGGDAPGPKGRARNGNANGNGRTSTRAPASAARTAEPEAEGATDGATPTPVAEAVAAPPSDEAEPLAEWELALDVTAEDDGSRTAASAATETAEAVVTEVQTRPGGPGGAGSQGEQGDGTGQGSRRRRRRNRDRSRGEGPQGADRFDNQPQGQPAQESFQGEPVAVAGYLDLRDEGYGFLRVNGYLASRDDVYVSVKQTRQYGLRKGDHVTGMSRPAGRNEKNPALLRIDTVNGGDPELARNRPKFEDLTPLFPDEKFRLENGADPTNMTARIIDLVAPIGKGQRGLIVSPPKAGKTFIMKTIATSIESDNPETKLIVLLVDERPEEVTDMRRTVKGEVIASTFDRPSDEHTHVAELAIERAKRMVENGDDVVVILDGITRLARAYNLAAPATGRIMSGGIDAGALYPPKKFFGAARNIEEGGSLTILATALVETNSRMDDAIFEEFKGTGNMELRLDRKLAERRIYPAIDVDASSTRHEELLFDRKQLQMVWKLRRVLSGLAEGGSAAAGLELLIDRLKT
ncbi:MAG TPA: transcription termination factor Rho, partial [Acidimicrobiales bacterium]